MKNKSFYLRIGIAGHSPRNGDPGILPEKPADWDAIQFYYQGNHFLFVPALTLGWIPEN